jgi:hypothetical protein
MSPLLRKEIRLILPFWGIALALGVIPVFAMRSTEWWHVSDGAFLLFAFGLTLLGLAPFGQEFGWGTFSIMLAQPVERRRIWKTKFLLTLAAGASVFLLFAWSAHVLLADNLREQVQWMVSIHHMDADKAVAMMGVDRIEFAPSVFKALALLLMAITGGLWTTLLFRQTGAALWFAILIPGVLVVIVEGIFHAASNTATDMAVDGMLLFYSIAGLAWAWRMFARAQDSQWLGETVAMFSLKSSRADVVSDKPRRKGAFRALVRKELQSNQISFVIAFGLLVLHSCTLIFRGVYVLPRNSEFRFALEAVPFLWLLMPWLMGCMAVAEERKLGTMESQLCLPVTRRLQFIIKIAMVLILGTVLGGFMPAIIETIGSGAGVSSEFMPANFASLIALEMYPKVIGVQLAALLIGVVSIFASSLTRNTLHALGLAIVVGGAWVMLFNWVQFQSVQGYEYTLWKGPLILVVGPSLAIVATIGLSFSNFKRLHAGHRVWLRNLAVLACTLVFAGFATAVLYQLPWELFMSVEPEHGAPVLSGSMRPPGPEPSHGAPALNGSVRPALYMPAGRICALLPDGRLWISTEYHLQAPNQEQPIEVGILTGNAVIPDGGTFVGSNWVALAANDQSYDVDAIRSDGTLWSILSIADATNSRSATRWLDVKPSPRQIGSDSDWKKVISVGYSFVAVKSNGTLWSWHGDGKGFLTNPKRIGTDSDWDTIFWAEYTPILVKRDGSVWGPPSLNGGPQGIPFYVPTKVNGADWLDVTGANNYKLVIKRDGSLWEWGMGGYRAFGLHASGKIQLPGWNRLGDDSDWMSIAGFPNDLVAVKGGRLVENGLVPFAESLGRASKYSDWLVADGSQDRVIALAADGTLCLWMNMPHSSAGLEWHTRSRRPYWSLNILTNSKN